MHRVRRTHTHTYILNSTYRSFIHSPGDRLLTNQSSRIYTYIHGAMLNLSINSNEHTTRSNSFLVVKPDGSCICFEEQFVSCDSLRPIRFYNNTDTTPQSRYTDAYTVQHTVDAHAPVYYFYYIVPRYNDYYGRALLRRVYNTLCVILLHETLLCTADDNDHTYASFKSRTRPAHLR